MPKHLWSGARQLLGGFETAFHNFLLRFLAQLIEIFGHSKAAA